MAGPKPTSYEPELQKLSSPTSHSNSPLSPGSRGETPISFRPNVNRAKTKRWVEAKSYSYDGNDWGDEDDDEFEEPPPVPRLQTPTGTTSSLPRPSFPGKDRSKSVDQVLMVEPDGASGSRSRSADDKEPAASPGVDPSSRKQVPFVRPADIYKRMREDKEKTGLPVATRSSTDPAASSSVSSLGQETTSNEPAPPASNIPSTASNPPILGLPKVKRMSGSSTDFLGESETSSAQNTPNLEGEESEEQRLQHNPSLGFRSVVNQAFDVPETPSSAVDSVMRSSSGSTSAVSPVIPSRGLDDEKTPTIVEEPGEVTPKDASDRNILFKPGHRRDLSLPSPDNSPSRKPRITDNEQTPPPVIAQLASATKLSDSPNDQPSMSLQQPKRGSAQLHPPPKDLPAPLRVSSNQTSVLGGSNETPAVIIPSLSSDNSPQDTESDRLRKEIIRSLSRENTPSDEPEQASRPQTRREDGSIPSEYESYWNEELTRSPQDPPNPSVPEYNSPNTTSQGLSSSNDLSGVGPAPAPWQGSQPKLKRRFSWESSSSEDPETAAGTYSQPMQDPPIPGQLPPDDDTELPSFTETQEEPARQSVTEKPKLTIIPPSAVDEGSIASGRHLPEVVYPPPTEPNAAPETVQQSLSPSTGPDSMPPNLLGFRDILGIRSSDERVRAFERTRDQFGSIDTGLGHWIQVTLQAHPEHGDIVGQNMKLSVGASKGLGKGKFPKLPSLGNFGSSNSQGAPPGHGHVRRTSAPLGNMMNKQQVEQRGKDLLHTAGAIGGRAGEAAKGLFSRGRTKLKGSGEKGSQSMRARNALQFPKLPGLSAIGLRGSGDRSHKRNTLHLGSLPLTRRPSLDAERAMAGSRQTNADTRGQDTDAIADKGVSQRPQSVPPQIFRSPWLEPEGQSDLLLRNPSGHSIPRKCVNCPQAVESQGSSHGRTQSRSKETRDRLLHPLVIPSSPQRKHPSSVLSLGVQNVKQTDDNPPVRESKPSLPACSEPGHVHFHRDQAPPVNAELTRIKTNTSTLVRAPSPYPSLHTTSEDDEDEDEAEPPQSPIRSRILQGASAGHKNALRTS